MIRLSSIMLVTGLLTSCATRYGEMGFSGGVSAQPVMTDVYRIQARGNGYTASSIVQDFVLMKAAETTLSNGGSHFLILSTDNQTSRSIEQTPGSAQTSIIGHTAFTTYNPGVTYDIIKPGQDVMIKILRLKSNEIPPMGAFPANNIVQTIGPRLKPVT
jgi:hypothetical protein